MADIEFTEETDGWAFPQTAREPETGGVAANYIAGRIAALGSRSGVSAELMKSALKRLEPVGFPHRTHELFTYCDLKKFASAKYASITDADAQDIARILKSHAITGAGVIPIVNGRLVAGKVDPAGISAAPLDKIEPAKSARLHDSISESIKTDPDFFSLLNASAAEEPLYIDIPAGITEDKPVLILLISAPDGKSDFDGLQFSAPRIIINVASGAKPVIIVKTVTAGELPESRFDSASLDIMVSAGAEAKLAFVQLYTGRAGLFFRTTAVQKENSALEMITALGGGSIVRHAVDARIEGEQARFRLDSAAVPNGREQVHQHVRVQHLVPRSTSMQKFRNIIAGDAASSVDTTVLVREGAQETESDQLVNNLLLSPTASADCKPNLMIFADDVKCTHGATMGRLSDDQLFYLKTRGLDESSARKLLTAGFVGAAVSLMPCGLAADASAMLMGKLGL